MVVDIEKYSINRKYVQEWYLSHPEDVKVTISIMATATNVPCIVICFFIGEVAGWTQEILDSIERFKTFYGYTEIENIPEGYPK